MALMQEEDIAEMRGRVTRAKAALAAAFNNNPPYYNVLFNSEMEFEDSLILEMESLLLDARVIVGRKFLEFKRQDFCYTCDHLFNRQGDIKLNRAYARHNGDSQDIEGINDVCDILQHIVRSEQMQMLQTIRNNSANYSQRGLSLAHMAQDYAPVAAADSSSSSSSKRKPPADSKKKPSPPLNVTLIYHAHKRRCGRSGAWCRRPSTARRRR